MLWFYHLFFLTIFRVVWNQSTFYNTLFPIVYINDIYKHRDYLFEFLKHIFVGIHGHITTYDIPNLNNYQLISIQTQHPIAYSFYQLEYAVYLYDMIVCFYNKLPNIFMIHHMITVFLMYLSERYHFMYSGIYVLNMLNTTTPFLHIAKMVRNCKNKKYQIYTDTFLWCLFFYHRIYRFTFYLYEHRQFIYDHHYYHLLDGPLLIVYGMQWLWFIRLTQIYKKDTLPLIRVYLK